MRPRPDFLPYGRDAFVARAPREEVRVLAEAARRLRDVAEVIEGYDEVLVRVRPGCDPGRVRGALGRGTPAALARPAPRSYRIPVTYDGPDLGAVAAAAGLTVAEAIGLHGAAAYEVIAIGFQPGFAYLGFLPERLRLPRRATPRTRVPAGSVAIAADQTAVYPHASPGGWHLIGRTGFPCFDASAPGLTPFRVGDRVAFVPMRRR